MIEALREGGLEGSVSVKRLLGLADRETAAGCTSRAKRAMRRIPPVELLNNLLYLRGARDQSTGPRVAAVRASFRLGELLPRRRAGRAGAREPLRALA